MISGIRSSGGSQKGEPGKSGDRGIQGQKGDRGLIGTKGEKVNFV